MAQTRLRIGDILVQQGLITEEQLGRALEQQKKGSKENFGAILVRLGFITEKDVALTLAGQIDIPFVSLAAGTLVPSGGAALFKRVPEEFARKHAILPLAADHVSLTVAMADPLNLVLLDNLRLVARCQTVHRRIATPRDIELAIDRFYGEDGLLKKAVEDSYLGEGPLEGASGGVLSLDTLLAKGEDAPVIKMVDLILRQAIKERASDIHIEPFREALSVRYRIDGVLREIPPPAKSMAVPLISRIKILAKMDIAERRLPQDGSFVAAIEKRTIDFRVSTVPTIHGEKVVMRILDRSQVELDLAKLGFQDRELETVRKMIRKPYGLILVTGPTGSGKTTTLYAALSEIRSAEKNILTIEDPVEYQIHGINQVQAKPDIGLTFAAGLRSFLRQDPDIILVGEIRDQETAQICVRASLTGHLVFSTLHTNDAPLALNRLTDIGVEPYLVTSCLLMVIGQRLVRRLCPACRQPFEPGPSDLPRALNFKTGVIYRARGCDKCGKTGYQGRSAIYEILMMTEKIERLVVAKAPMSEIVQAAREAGMTTLVESGYRKVLAGETTLEEVHTITLQAGD